MSRILNWCGLSYTGYITICGSLLWFCYVSIEARVTLRSALYFLCNCFRKLTMIRSISSTAASVSFLCLLLLIIYLWVPFNHLAYGSIIAVEFTSFMAGPGLYRYWSNKVSPTHGLYLARAVKILSPLTAGCESTLHEKEPASGYNVLLTTCCWAQEKCSDDLHHKLIKSNMIRIHHDLLICATFMSFVIMHNTLINFILT